MKIFHSYKAFKSNKKGSAVTIGTFDGLHMGHKKILTQLKAHSKQHNLDAVVFTLFPHPRMVLQDNDTLKLLNTIDERIALFEEFGINCLVIEAFSKDFSRLSALDFVRNILVNHLNTKLLIVGYDHQFGRNREGDFDQLKEYSELYNYEIVQIAQQDIEDVAVSSTKIRAALANGNITTANKYLGYHYMLSGKVIKGQGLGKTLDFPTVNLHIEESYKLIPKTGVYVIKTAVKGKTLYGIMNIGFRPTVNGKNQTIETYLLDFKGDLYGKKLKIYLLYRLRDELKFASLQELKIQIKSDALAARKYIDSIPKN
ncbi:MAG: bifunctional riboflavin kinase/FAD synthetase [Flavobacteriaceae bacterium]|nr:bifunctional riboflavin kinase/FAD synthetase [Flavobacteriaceae bacterium]